MINFGVIGYGYWGPNIVRNFGTLKDLQSAVCDQSPAARKRAQAAHPHFRSVQTRTRSLRHRDRCRRGGHAGLDALRTGQGGSGKRQARLCRKAVHLHRRAGEELIELAARKNLKIMVDHTFLFTGAVGRSSS